MIIFLERKANPFITQLSKDHWFLLCSMIKHKGLVIFCPYTLFFSNIFVWLELAFVQKYFSSLDFSDLSRILKNIEFIANGSEGGVMKCEIDKILFPLAIKMHFNYGHSTKTHMKLCVEAVILKEIPTHPNIIFLIHDFYSRPTHEMVSYCTGDEEVRQMMIKEFNASTGKNDYRTSLFLIYKSYPSNLYVWSLEKRKDCRMNDIIRICYEISCGVLHLWNHGVVHRDLKLNNILIDDEGHIVIIDLGMAVKLDVNGKAFVVRNGGNQAHLAPEVLNCDFSRGGKIEVDYSKQPSFALGVLFHEILTGSHPFDMYPLDSAKYGEGQNISVPPLDFERINNIKNFVVDEKFTFMIRDLLLPFSNRMTLKDCNDTLKKLFTDQFSQINDHNKPISDSNQSSLHNNILPLEIEERSNHYPQSTGEIVGKKPSTDDVSSYISLLYTIKFKKTGFSLKID